MLLQLTSCWRQKAIGVLWDTDSLDLSSLTACEHHGEVRCNHNSSAALDEEIQAASSTLDTIHQRITQLPNLRERLAALKGKTGKAEHLCKSMKVVFLARLPFH